VGVAILVIVNVAVWALPDGHYRKVFNHMLAIAHEQGSRAEVVVFGDSRATMFNAAFFNAPTLSFACANNTIVYSTFLFDRMIAETATRPKVVVLMLGANNYNENGIFTLRDFAIRRLTTLGDIARMAKTPGGKIYALDAFFSRAFPVYGRRMEIRSPRQIVNMVRSGAVTVGAMEPPAKEYRAPERSEIEDLNYLMIYRRSVYVNYRISRLHTGVLEDLIDQAEALGARVVLVQLPVEPVMRMLHDEVVGTVFDEYLTDMARRKGAVLLDLRDNLDYEFADLNHLTERGAMGLTHDILNPVIDSLLASEPEPAARQ
jgi:hypothetical protein